MTASSRLDDTARAADALERLAALHPKLIDLGLERSVALLDRLGDPHRRLPPAIHVAGTNGKGSVIALMRAMAEAAGLRVHVYASPHLCRFNERIRLAGKLIGDGALADLLEEVETANGSMPVTFFEVTTAAAMLAFSRVDADLLLLETGLGGALDSTNVLTAPAATVITPVARDHEHFLGSDLAGIAGQKAGIMRRGVPCFSARATSRGGRRARSACSRNRHLCCRAGARHRMGGTAARRIHRRHRRRPARHAVTVAYRRAPAGERRAGRGGTEGGSPRSLRFPTGFRPEKARWPGRLQELPEGPLRDMISAPVWVDGAHNAHGAAALAAALPLLDDGKWHFICGALDTRPPGEFLNRIAPHAASIRCVTIPDQPASLPAKRWQARRRTCSRARARPVGCGRVTEPCRWCGR